MRERVKLTPYEVEKEMQEARKADGFFGNSEISIVRHIIDNAKRNSQIGDKIILVINPLYIHMPEWQRELDIPSAKTIGENYNTNLWEPVKIYCRNGKLYCADGSHRIYGKWKANADEITADLMLIDEKEAIEMFLEQSKGRRKMTPSDQCKAAIAAQKEEWIKLQEICTDNHINIKGNDKTVSEPIGTITCVSDAVSLAKANPERLDAILKLIEKLQWGEGAYNAKIIRSLKSLYGFCGNFKKTMEAILLKECKGREYFVKNIAPKSQYATFDYLSEIINNSHTVKLTTIHAKQKSLKEALQKAVQ